MQDATNKKELENVWAESERAIAEPGQSREAEETVRHGTGQAGERCPDEGAG